MGILPTDWVPGIFSMCCTPRKAAFSRGGDLWVLALPPMMCKSLAEPGFLCPARGDNGPWHTGFLCSCLLPGVSSQSALPSPEGGLHSLWPSMSSCHFHRPACLSPACLTVLCKCLFFLLNCKLFQGMSCGSYNFIFSIVLCL